MGTGCWGVATIAMTSGAGSSRSTSRTIGCDGLRRATSPDGEIRARTSRGQPLIQPVGHRPREDQGDRPRPEPPGQPAAHLRDPGHPVGDLRRTLQQQGQRPRRLAGPQLPHPRHAGGVQGAGDQAVDRLGRQADDAPLRQARDRTMDHIALVVGLRYVDPLRRNRLVSHRTPSGFDPAPHPRAVVRYFKVPLAIRSTRPGRTVVRLGRRIGEDRRVRRAASAPSTSRISA